LFPSSFEYKEKRALQGNTWSAITRIYRHEEHVIAHYDKSKASDTYLKEQIVSAYKTHNMQFMKYFNVED